MGEMYSRPQPDVTVWFYYKVYDWYDCNDDALSGIYNTKRRTTR